MTAPKPSPEAPIVLNISVDPNQPGLLDGLENWVQLGLISDAQVRQMGQKNLSCSLPEPVPDPVAAPTPTPQLEPLEAAILRISSKKKRPKSAPPTPASSILTTTPSPTTPSPTTPSPTTPSPTTPSPTTPSPTTPSPTTPSPTTPPSAPLIPRLTQAFIENFSITWLLFLGVFMVVLSSIVLAASQWQSVPPAGQYSILLVYTIAFWGAASWTQRQENLQITAQMLRVTTLLIIPVNFWMIDSLGLWQSVIGWGLGIVAAIALSLMTILLLHPKPDRNSGEPDRDRSSPQPTMIAALNTIALSGLHWGWAIPSFPVIATYMGTIGTAILVSRYQTAALIPDPPLPLPDPLTPLPDPPPPSTESTATAPESPPDQPLDLQSPISNLHPPPSNPSTHPSAPLPLITVAFATVLLVIRAVVAANVAWSQLGLAIGLCGWVISWISRTSVSRDLWMKGGAKLLLLGWLVSVASTPPWQALAVSGLGLWIVGDRFFRYWTRIDLTTLFILGLQSLWLVQRIVPGQFRQYLLDLCIRLSGDQGMPEALWGLTVFPYVLLTLGVATYLYRQDRFSLGRYADWLALGLGVCLTTLSLLNPVTRSLNITLSTITLAVTFRHRSIVRAGYLHLFHGLAIATLLSWINTIFPTLTPIQWAVILTVIAVGEWLLHLRVDNAVLAKSTWYGGLGLGAIAYPLFLTHPEHSWCATWFALPTVMLGVGQRSNRISAPLAGWLVALAVFMGQGFIVLTPIPYQAWGFSGCAVLLLWSTMLTCSIWSAAFGVGFGILATWLLPYQLDWLINESLVYWVMATPALLWLVWTPLQSRSSPPAQSLAPQPPVQPLAQIYTRAVNGWAIAISATFMTGFVLYALLLYGDPYTASGGISDNGAVHLIGYTLLVVGAIGYRFIWHPTQLGLWGLATGFGVLTAEGIIATYPSIPYRTAVQLFYPHPLTPYLGLAFLCWGLGFLVLIPERFQFRDRPNLLSLEYGSSRHLIPLFYGLLGSVLVLAKLNDGSLATPITDLGPLWYPALAALVLWGMHWWYDKQSAHRLFTVATDGGAIGLTALITVITVDTITRWYGLESLPTSAITSFGVLMVLMIGAIAFRQWQHPTELGTVGLAATVGLLVAGVIPWFGGGREELAIALLILGLLTQLAGDWFVQRWNRPYSPSVHLIPLAYGSVGWLLSQVDFTATMGFYTLAAALIGIGVSRRQPNFKPLTFLALAGTSLAAYQLLFYQMQQASGGQTGDGMMLLGGLAIALVILYILATLERLGRGFRHYCRLTAPELAALGHLHWLLSNGFLLLALSLPRSPTGHTLGIAIFAGLSTYAFTQGNHHFPSRPLPFTFPSPPNSNLPTPQPPNTPNAKGDATRTLQQEIWTSLGILEFLATMAYLGYRLTPDPSGLWQWAGAIAAFMAVGFKLFPWDSWGWPPRPGHRTAVVLPIGTLLLSASVTNIPSILLVAAFYAWLAYTTDRIRLSYLSVFCIGWAVLWFLQLQQWEQVIWMALDLGGAVLYVIQVDPRLRSPDQRNIRHYLRLITTGLICFVSVTESLGNLWLGIFTLLLSLGFLLAGIGLRTRAYLYVGTGTLLFEVLRYTRQFVGQNPLQIWAVGIVLGLGFIWIAATFEARRNQVNTALNYWRNELESWE